MTPQRTETLLLRRVSFMMEREMICSTRVTPRDCGESCTRSLMPLMLSSKCWMLVTPKVISYYLFIHFVLFMLLFSHFLYIYFIFIGTRSLHLERHIAKNARHKHLVLVLNKCDLVPPWVSARWAHVLSREVN